MNILVLDGHPDSGRLASRLLDFYQAAVPASVSVSRFNVRDLDFAPNLATGYAADQAWEPDLRRLAQALRDCDHLVVGFPLWWGAEPAQLKGLLDRLLLPGFAFRYHAADPFWDRLLAGRSADLIITMDTPPWYLRLIYGDPVVRRWRGQVLGFCGCQPVRVYRFGPTRRGGAAKAFEAWAKRLTKAARTAEGLRRGARCAGPYPGIVPEAILDRKP